MVRVFASKHIPFAVTFAGCTHQSPDKIFRTRLNRGWEASFALFYLLPSVNFLEHFWGRPQSVRLHGQAFCTRVRVREAFSPPSIGPTEPFSGAPARSCYSRDRWPVNKQATGNLLCFHCSRDIFAAEHRLNRTNPREHQSARATREFAG